MEPMEKEHINAYLRVPVVLIIVFAVIAGLQIIFIPKLGIGSACFVAIYSVVLPYYNQYIEAKHKFS